VSRDDEPKKPRLTATTAAAVPEAVADRLEIDDASDGAEPAVAAEASTTMQLAVDSNDLDESER
jgi:hypothetical protein